MGFRFVVLGAVLFSLFSVGVGARTLQESWSGTGLGFDTLFNHHINSRLCTSNPIDFLGCVQGLNALSGLTTPPTLLIPVSQLQARRAEYTRIQHRFGPLAWVVKNPDYETPTTGRGRAADFELWRTTRDAHIAAIRGLFAQRSEIDFDYLLSHLRNQFNSSDAQAYVASVAINQYLSSTTDPHSRIVPQAEDDQRAHESSTRVVGIGVSLLIRDSRPVVTQVNPNGPAARGGVEVFDEIIQVDGVPTRSQDMQAITSRIRGAEGSSVTLRLRRSGRLITKEIRREKIEYANVTAQTLSFAQGNVAVIRIENFVDLNGCESIKREIREINASPMHYHALVLDLRGNLGGNTGQALCIASIFLGPDKIVFVKRSLGDSMVREERSSGPALTQLPMVTLMDANSASASELVAGALQDHRRSWIAGQRSYGKGTVQIRSDYPHASGIYIWRTIARFFQPSGRSNQIVGIQPDFEIAPKPGATADELFAIREGDEFPNPLEAQSAPWVQPRPTEAQAVLSRCAGYEERAARAYRGRGPSAVTPDYALHSAAELALCARR